jgi:ubiquinone/menaquinone biosynthesis C-methylase UbiE
MKTINQVKKYWDRRPCNINHSKKKFLSKEYFDEIRRKRYFIEKHIKKFVEFHKYNNKKVLEVGCGIGTDGVEFIKNGANYTGIEISSSSLRIFKKRCELFKLNEEKYNLVCMNAENLSKLKQKYDLIYSFGVIHHSPNMKKIFDEIYKISKKKTEIKIMLYAKNSYKNFMLELTNYRFEAQKNCPVVYRIDKTELNDLVKNKFKIISCYQDFIFPYKIKLYKNNIYKKIKHFEVMPNKIFTKLCKELGDHLLINLKKI